MSMVEVIGSRAQVILKSIKDLEQIELLERMDRGEYQLTPIGRVVYKKVEDFIKLLHALLRHCQKYFCTSLASWIIPN